MSHTSPFKQSSARNRRKLAAAIEGLESRSYLTGVVFGTPVNTSAASAGISPVYVNLDDVLNTTVSGKVVADLISANVSSGGAGSVSILPGNGVGGFGTADTVPLDFSPLTIRTGALVSGSSNIDIVVGSTTTTTPTFGVLLNNGGGSFTETDYTATGLSDTQSVAIGDFNGDGNLDIAVASDDAGTSNNVAIFLNDGTGHFTLHQVLSVPHSFVSSITAFNAGGNLTDLAVSDANANAVTVLNNDGSGNFTVNPQEYTVGAEPVTITTGKFDSSGHDDLVTANEADGSVSVLLGNGDGTFQQTAKTTAVAGAAPGGGPLKVRVANVNSDNIPDLICLLSPGSSGDAEVLLGNGDGTFHVGNVIATGGATRTAIAAGDLNGDGLTDMVLASSGSSGQVTSLINTTNLDTTAPTAALSVNQPSASAGAATIDFTVTYTDAEQVDTSTLGNGNLTVSNPSGTTETATLVSTGLTPAASVTATYSIPAQGNSASPADDGAYTVTANSNSVLNAGGVALAAGTIGQFTVNVLVNQNGPNLVAGAVNVRNPATAVAGTRFAGATSVTVLNSGNQLAKGKITIALYASTSSTIPGGTTPLESVVRNVNLKPGKKVVYALPGFKWPTGTGIPNSFFVVADVNSTQSLAETSYADNIGISAKSTAVALPFVNIENLWSGKLPATIKVGRRTPLAVALKNLGNTIARNTAAYTVQAEDASDNLTTIGTGTVRVVAAAQGRTAVSIPVTVPSSLLAGTYHIVITVSYPGDTNAGDDSATSSNTFTV